MVTRGGQTFPKPTEIRNSVAFRPLFSVRFRAFQSVVANSVSEQLLQLPWRTNGLGGQFGLSKESVSTSGTDCQISAPICTKYGLQNSLHAELMDCTANIKFFNNMHIGSCQIIDSGWRYSSSAFQRQHPGAGARRPTTHTPLLGAPSLPPPKLGKRPSRGTLPKRQRQNQTARAMNAQGRPQRRAADTERPGERPCGPRWCFHRRHRTRGPHSVLSLGCDSEDAFR